MPDFDITLSDGAASSVMSPPVGQKSILKIYLSLNFSKTKNNSKCLIFLRQFAQIWNGQFDLNLDTR